MDSGLDAAKWQDSTTKEPIHKVCFVSDCDNAITVGIEFLGADDAVLLSVGETKKHESYRQNQFQQSTVVLSGSERLVGVRSSQRDEAQAFHADLQFMIAEK